YIGIIGESLLGGVFEKSKESIAEFIEILSSEQAQTWAEQTGKAIGDLFSRVVDSIKSGITWFNNLSSSQQKMIMKFGAVVIAAGPLLTAFGVLGGVIAKLSSGLGTFFKFLAPIMTPLKNIATVAAEGGKKIGLLSRDFT